MIQKLSHWYKKRATKLIYERRRRDLGEGRMKMGFEERRGKANFEKGFCRL